MTLKITYFIIKMAGKYSGRNNNKKKHGMNRIDTTMETVFKYVRKL